MKAKILREIYERLYNHFGPQGWWPAETPFEVCIGAILTQNTNWQNVERAIKKLREKDLLNPQKLYEISESELAEIIRPSGYYNIKTKRLKNFINFLMEEYGGDLEVMKGIDLHSLRKKLLRIKGLGPETVDSILLYALEKPVFVVDAYTYRILLRHGLIPEEVTYEELQELFHSAFDEDIELFQEYHALLVVCGKNYCKKSNPLCEPCPLAELK